MAAEIKTDKKTNEQNILDSKEEKEEDTKDESKDLLEKDKGNILKQNIYIIDYTEI